jgi:hypothetical protein
MIPESCLQLPDHEWSCQMSWLLSSGIHSPSNRKVKLSLNLALHHEEVLWSAGRAPRFLICALYGGKRSASHSRQLTPGNRPTVCHSWSAHGGEPNCYQAIMLGIVHCLRYTRCYPKVPGLLWRRKTNDSMVFYWQVGIVYTSVGSLAPFLAIYLASLSFYMHSSETVLSVVYDLCFYYDDRFWRTCLHQNDANFCSKIITGDETLVYRYDLETQQQSSQCKSPSSLCPTKAKQVRLNVKSMLIIFFDINRIIHHGFVPQGQTVNQHF